MMGPRIVLPEKLDHLPPENPQAIGSRRDLARINALMMNGRVVAGLLAGRPLSNVLEIGAGDGRFLLSVVRRLGSSSSGACLTLLDRQPLMTETRRAEFYRLGWRCENVSSDVFEYLRRGDEGPFDAIVANLFLHHFEDAALAELLSLIAGKTGLLVACEPARSALALTGTRTLGAIGCNAVTRHDARVSVLAGFCDRELSALWPKAGDWRLEERAVPPFSHAFRAERKG